jgi:hypothetical protein
MKVEIIRELDGFTGLACLVRRGEEFFVVSSIDGLPTARGQLPSSETMAFRSDADGRVTDWGDVAGGRGATRADVIADLESAQ